MQQPVIDEATEQLAQTAQGLSESQRKAFGTLTVTV